MAAAAHGEVRFGKASRALYSTGASNYGQLPIGVVLPRAAKDVIVAVRTVIVADGFSCREQVRRQTDPHALHLAHVLHRAQLDGVTSDA